MILKNDWNILLKNEIESDYYNDLLQFVNYQYDNHKCYPPKDFIFSAFNHCSFSNTRVVIIGQDPYHGLGQANGLCFSVSDGVKFPPSLINIFKEIEKDLGEPIPISGNLERWASQGVLMLNAILTVKEATPGSHQNKGWERFTDAVIKQISDQKKGVVFLLWGAYAQKKGKIIDTKKHCVLTSGHPSPMSANRGFWFDNKHFSQTNLYLKHQGYSKIDW